MTDHFADELKFSTETGLRHIITDPIYTPVQRAFARNMLARREAFAAEVARIDRLGEPKK